MSADAISQSLFLACLLIYGLAWVFYFQSFSRRLEAAEKRARIAVLAGVVLQAAALMVRGFLADHAPWANQYESATFVSFGAVLLFYFFQRRNQVPVLGLFVMPAAMLAIGAASILPGEYKRMAPLMPALQSYWLKIHVSCMLLSYGAFACTFGCSMMYLIREGAWTKSLTKKVAPFAGAVVGAFFAYVYSTAPMDKPWQTLSDAAAALHLPEGTFWPVALAAALAAVAASLLAWVGLKALPSEWVGRLPESMVLDELNYKSVALGFPILTTGVILGAMWGHVAWGRYWGWDPKETWAFITWLIFAAYLHMRIFAGWQGKKIAWIGLLGSGSVIFTYWGVNFLLSGLHAYAKP
jgi:cytochrome c-type biogenesis protein CcsB